MVGVFPIAILRGLERLRISEKILLNLGRRPKTRILAELDDHGQNRSALTLVAHGLPILCLAYKRGEHQSHTDTLQIQPFLIIEDAVLLGFLPI